MAKHRRLTQSRITSKYYGTMCYASPVWMTITMSSQIQKQLNRQHYRAAYKDKRCKLSREELDGLSGRAFSAQWSKCIMASTVIKLMKNGTTPMAHKLRQRAYINDRGPGRATFIDRSWLKIGKQSLPNRLDFFWEIKFNWWERYQEISKDKLRAVLIKKQFFLQQLN